MQIFGAGMYKEWDPIQRELLTKRFVRLDVTRTRLMLTEWGRAVPRALGPH
jgi:hypothetical protein